MADTKKKRVVRLIRYGLGGLGFPDPVEVERVFNELNDEGYNVTVLTIGTRGVLLVGSLVEPHPMQVLMESITRDQTPQEPGPDTNQVGHDPAPFITSKLMSRVTQAVQKTKDENEAIVTCVKEMLLHVPLEDARLVADYCERLASSSGCVIGDECAFHSRYTRIAVQIRDQIHTRVS